MATRLYVPSFVGVKTTAHEAVAPVPERMQMVEENLPASVEENVTMPDGVITDPTFVSVTLAEHLVAASLRNGLLQLTVVEDECGVIVSTNGELTLPALSMFPP